MKKATLFALALLLTATSLSAAESKMVTYKSGDETVSGELYTPAGKGPFPALIVIHEWWGLNDWIKEQASKLADQGYVTLAIDLYRGKVATTPNEAHEFMGESRRTALSVTCKPPSISCSLNPTLKKIALARLVGAWAGDTRCNWRSTSHRSELML